MTGRDALVVATALALYGYNVSPGDRAEALFNQFNGACAEIEELLRAMTSERVAFAATELATPTALVYVEHALARYGEEAKRRVDCELGIGFGMAP